MERPADLIDKVILGQSVTIPDFYGNYLPDYANVPVQLCFQTWLEGVDDKPAEIIPLAEVKRAMFMIYSYGQAILVETEDKWIAPFWYPQNDDIPLSTRYYH